MIGKRVVILVFILSVFQSFGQNLNFYQKLFNQRDTLVKRYDSSRIDPLLDKVTLRLFATQKLNEQRFSDSDAANVWQNNQAYKLGVGFGYRWLILNFALYAPLSKIDRFSKGKTTAYNLQVNVYGRKVLFDFRTQYYQGYFLKNTQAIFPGWEDEVKHFLRPDMNLFAIGGNLRVNLNSKNYSFKHSYDQTQLMKKSGGAFELAFRYSYQNLSADSAFTYGLTGAGKISGIESGNIGLGGGYSYTLILGKKWFLTGTVNPYLNLQSTTFYKEEGNLVNKVVTNFTAIFRGAAGYTNPNYYIGVTWVGDRVANRYGSTKYDYTYTVFKLIYAYRFTSKWWKSKGL